MINRNLPIDLKAKALCRGLLQSGEATADFSTTEAAVALTHAVERGWVMMEPFGLTEIGKKIATRSRAGHLRPRRLH